jgi:hypothetical protein
MHIAASNNLSNQLTIRDSHLFIVNNFVLFGATYGYWVDASQ